ncbi:CPBP family intramembrane glutamic endopeptidase [Flavobacterium macacae]|uniref:CPBP family intramembrane metalloprotease n=1 Tax=Flavobacterium macacae TaxID=2488993 RepID=A0A3P3WGU7_9FLAO|nr:type II CAAX endopeptidase family protein [Flavobacterium macacae]RRJ92879.1 CPBP family intramembrane metalloprotease [Flavobacterium macacae]
MKHAPKLKSYLTILIFLIVGMLVMGIAQLFKTPAGLNSAFILLALFIIVNIATAKIFNLKSEIQSFWSIKKIYLLPVGIVAGGLIAISPVLAGLLTGATQFSELKFDTKFTLSSIAVTLAIVAWEELWFRGIFLNYCNRNLSAIHISITIGLLFMMVHLLNPEINLLKTGPTLFFAGAFLTIVYFYFKTIWLPIGLHFGNNYLIIQSNLDTHWLFGNEGYLGAIILALLFLLFVKLIINKTKKI